MSPSPKSPKRYYKRLVRFPEGVDRLDAEVRLPVTQEQIGQWVDDLFPGGGMKAMVGYIILKYGAWEQAMDAAQSGASTTTFRAAWAMEWAYEQAESGDVPEWFFDRVTGDFCASGNGSLQRIYAKMICDMMRFGDGRNVSSTEARRSAAGRRGKVEGDNADCGTRPTGGQAESLAEKCFDLVIAPGTKTALKFWCLEIICELSPRLDWVAEELPATLLRISEAPDCTPGLRVATREILKRLK